MIILPQLAAPEGLNPGPKARLMARLRLSAELGADRRVAQMRKAGLIRDVLAAALRGR